MTTVAIATLGCKVNQCDSAALQEALEQDGCAIVPFSGSADMYIVNTCTVTGSTESQSRQLVRRALRLNEEAQVLVTGCYVQKSTDELCAISNRVHVIGNHEKKDIVAFVEKIVRGQAAVREVSDIGQEKTFTTPAFSKFMNRSRAFLKIQDGCNARCSYCIVPSVRGRSRSLPPEEVRARLVQLVSSGYQEIVLTGIHLGAFGLDLQPPTSLTKLVKSFGEDDRLADTRIRLSSIEPTEFTEQLRAVFSDVSQVCHHVHVPLQSGDDAVLKQMRRPYTTSLFRDVIERLVDAVPDMNIGIDVIVGFPGETEEQFENTVAFLRDLPAGYLHVFPYSRRQGTPAADFSGQVPERVKKERVHVLRQLSEEMKSRFQEKHIGRTLQVLVESSRDKTTGMLKGFSRNYIPVVFEGSASLFGKEVAVKATDVMDGKARGVLQ